MILIFPWSRKLNTGGPNPKNYPWWPELITMLDHRGHNVVQVSLNGEVELVSDVRKSLPLLSIAKLIEDCTAWISIDSFAQHFCWSLNKKGIVLWGQSDPKIFGHAQNINLLKDRSYLRPNQFLTWDLCEVNDEAFVTPDVVVRHLNELLYFNV